MNIKHLKYIVITRKENYMKVDRNKLEMIQAKLNLTSKELIQKTGISSTTYCKIKSNKSVSPLVVGKIARALDCEVETLAKKE